MLCIWIFHIVFGMVVEMKQMSTKDRLERKKYMGVWMQHSSDARGVHVDSVTHFRLQFLFPTKRNSACLIDLTSSTCLRVIMNTE